uniref:Major facilitator superfamily (MFS) profile domain-containing protein n=1 Tax=Ciona intestinalis TaxID=7719 RepID=F6TMW8_CIOIN
MDAESAFKLVGNFGRYQCFLAMLLFMCNFIAAGQLVLMVLVGATPNTTIPNEQNLTTIVTEFNLYDKPWVVELTQSLLMVGFMVGCFCFGQVADVYGRRPVLLIGGGVTGICGICSGFCQCWETFAATRFLTGVFVGATSSSAFVTMSEFLGKSTWAVVGLFYSCCFSVGIMLLALIGYLVQQWRVVCYITGGMFIAMLPLLILFLPESPRWLYSTGKTEEAERMLKMFARRNGREDGDIHLTPAERDTSRTHTLADFFRYKILAKWLLASVYIWFTCSLVYYGLTMGAASLTTDLYVGICLSGAIEIPATLGCIVFMNWKWVGRKGTLMLLFIIGGGSCIALIFVPGTYETTHLVLGLASKLAIAAAFAVVYIFTSEIFPTPVRTVALGTSSTIARLGSVISPFILLSVKSHPYVPYLIFGICMVLGVAVTFLLPETFARVLPQTVEEVVEPHKHMVSSQGNEDNAPL